MTKYINWHILLAFGVAFEIAHLFEFGILYLLLILLFATFGKVTNKVQWMAMVLSFMYGCMDEIHQYFVPFRSASFIDLAKNTIGILTVWYLVRRSLNQPHSKIRRFINKVSSQTSSDHSPIQKQKNDHF